MTLVLRISAAFLSAGLGLALSACGSVPPQVDGISIGSLSSSGSEDGDFGSGSSMRPTVTPVPSASGSRRILAEGGERQRGESGAGEAVERKEAAPSLTPSTATAETGVAPQETPPSGESASPPAQDCTPGYSPCLPPAYDYDCIGGSGNGPAYTGRVEVTGVDIYELDRDGDGIGCE